MSELKMTELETPPVDQEAGGALTLKAGVGRLHNAQADTPIESGGFAWSMYGYNSDDRDRYQEAKKARIAAKALLTSCRKPLSK